MRGEALSYEEEWSPDPASPRWWSTLLVPVLDESGECVRIYGVSHEVSEVYEVYAELTRANTEFARAQSHLETRVAERTQELEAAKARLEELARVDELTSTWNRRYLFEIAPALMERCRRDGRPLGGIMMDADHFKLLNDRYGHQAGDDALARLAATIRANLRAADTVGRYGGEEFLALLPGADLAAAELVAERIRSAVAAEPGFPFLSISLGVAAVDPATDDLVELTRRADDGLLQAKQAGRNRVMTAKPAFASVSSIC
jgi:diguanylate cyclase (GGDEF)-like protein